MAINTEELEVSRRLMAQRIEALERALECIKFRLYVLRDGDEDWEDAANGAWEIANDTLGARLG